MDNKFDSGLACLIIILKFLNVRVSQQEIEHITATKSFPLDDLALLGIAKSFKLHGKLKKLKLEEIKSINRPVIVKDNSDKYFIVAKVTDDKIMVLYPDKRSPEMITYDDFKKQYSGISLLFKKERLLIQKQNLGLNGLFPQYLSLNLS